MAATNVNGRHLCFNRHCSLDLCRESFIASCPVYPSSVLFGTLPTLQRVTLISVLSGVDKAPADNTARGPRG